ncbi:MAG: hypothetical protein AAF604_19540 [Acidobacteriota bacterium]
MRVDNGTTDPVDFEQTGGGGDPDDELENCQVTGNLKPGGSATFVPGCRPPWTVVFRDNSKHAKSRPLQANEANAKVVLCATAGKWKVKINADCD